MSEQLSRKEAPAGGPAPHPFKIMKLKDYITLLGTVFGVLAIWVAISQVNQWIACIFIFFGTGCDLLDGYVARKLHQINEIGGELDSLSDVIVFNVAPAALMYSGYASSPFLVPWVLPFLVIATVAFICCGVIRLAWFNVSKGAEGYTGLVVPIGALYLVAYYLMTLFWAAVASYSILTFLSSLAPFFILFVGILEIAPFLIYDKAVKKKEGKTKTFIFISAGVAGALAVCGVAFYAMSPIITFMVIMIAFIMVTVYILIGFRNWLRLRRQ